MVIGPRADRLLAGRVVSGAHRPLLGELDGRLQLAQAQERAPAEANGRDDAAADPAAEGQFGHAEAGGGYGDCDELKATIEHEYMVPTYASRCRMTLIRLPTCSASRRWRSGLR